MAGDSNCESRGSSQLSQATIRTLERVDVDAGPLAKFWDRYWGSKEGTAAVVDGVLTLASSVDTEQAEPYIIREDYIKAMREVVVAHYRGERNSFVGYGQPGIGKSIFLRILLALCFELCIPVIFGAVDESSATLFTNDGVFELPHEKVKRCTFFQPPIVLLDAAGKEPVPSAWYTNKRFTVFLSSSFAEYQYAELVCHRATTFVNFSLWRRYELVHFLLATARMAANPPAQKVPCALASYVFPTSRSSDGPASIITTSDDGDTLVLPRALPKLRLVLPPADVLAYWNCRASARNHYGPLETFDVLGPRIRTVIDGVKKEQGDLIRDGIKRVALVSVIQMLSDAIAALSAGTPVPAISQRVGFHKVFYEMPTHFFSQGQPAVRLIIPSAELQKLFLNGAHKLEKIERDRLFVQLRSHCSLFSYTYELSDARSHFARLLHVEQSPDSASSSSSRTWLPH